MAVGDSGTVRLSVDQGISWRLQAVPTAENLRAVTWSSGSRFVAVGTLGTVLVSSDGINWVVKTSAVTVRLNDVIWASDRFLAVGAGNVILSSQ